MRIEIIADRAQVQALDLSSSVSVLFGHIVSN